MAVPYPLSNKITSGALYHLVTTWPVNSYLGFSSIFFVLFDLESVFFIVFFSAFGRLSSGSTIYFWVTTPYKDLASPKSHILIEQSSLINTFAGFKSLWITPAECRYFNAISKL